MFPHADDDIARCPNTVLACQGCCKEGVERLAAHEHLRAVHAHVAREAVGAAVPVAAVELEDGVQGFAEAVGLVHVARRNQGLFPDGFAPRVLGLGVANVEREFVAQKVEQADLRAAVALVCRRHLSVRVEAVAGGRRAVAPEPTHVQRAVAARRLRRAARGPRRQAEGHAGHAAQGEHVGHARELVRRAEPPAGLVGDVETGLDAPAAVRLAARAQDVLHARQLVGRTEAPAPLVGGVEARPQGPAAVCFAARAHDVLHPREHVLCAEAAAVGAWGVEHGLDAVAQGCRTAQTYHVLHAREAVVGAVRRARLVKPVIRLAGLAHGTERRGRDASVERDLVHGPPQHGTRETPQQGSCAVQVYDA